MKPIQRAILTMIADVNKTIESCDIETISENPEGETFKQTEQSRIKRLADCTNLKADLLALYRKYD